VEDVELGMRLAERGGRTELDPHLFGTHLKGWTLWTMVRTDLNDRAIPWVGLILRRRSIPQVLNLGWRHRLSAALSLTIATATLQRRVHVLSVSLTALVALNGPFYSLLLRRLGPVRAALAVGMHILHHLTALLAIPTGLVSHAWKARIRRRPQTGPVRIAVNVKTSRAPESGSSAELGPLCGDPRGKQRQNLSAAVRRSF
jgi:hypothetical protein